MDACAYKTGLGRLGPRHLNPTRELRRAVSLALAGIAGMAHASPFPGNLMLGDIAAGDGTQGFVLDGTFAFGDAGFRVATGDLNGDGLTDLFIGAPEANPDGLDDSGEAYVVFGIDGGRFPAQVDLAELGEPGGVAGLTITGSRENQSTGATLVAAGDLNGDGADEVIVNFRDPADQSVGVSVLFGTDGELPARVTVDAIVAGESPFVLTRILSANSESFFSNIQPAGDVNGDGLGDLAIAEYFFDEPRQGAVYVVLGREEGFPAEIALADLSEGDGESGFVLRVPPEASSFALTAGSAGDFNGDGVDDLVVDNTYLVFGQESGFPAEVDLAQLLSGNADLGVLIDDDRGPDEAGFFPLPCRASRTPFAAGDVNGDGVDDLMVACENDTRYDDYSVGSLYVLSGDQQPGERIGLGPVEAGEDPTGVVIVGDDGYDYTGRISAAGDINGDGLADLLVNAYSYGAGGGTGNKAFVIFGRTDAPARQRLGTFADGNGVAGFQISAEGRDDGAARAVALGDVNGDGLTDIIIGAPYVDGGANASGRVYVVYGQSDVAVTGQVVGISATFAGCANTSDPQSGFSPLPAPGFTASWDCGALGVPIQPADGARVFAGGIAVTPLFQGEVSGFGSAATATCVNDTRQLVERFPVADDGRWQCAAGGFEFARGERVRVILSRPAQ